jgi:type II secretory pathway pseudopilin PulG
MKIKLISDSGGFSLLESIVAIGLVSAAGVAYMTHVQTRTQNEMRMKSSSAIRELER